MTGLLHVPTPTTPPPPENYSVEIFLDIIKGHDVKCSTSSTVFIPRMLCIHTLLSQWHLVYVDFIISMGEN
jgi:hypothetical protein